MKLKENIHHQRINKNTDVMQYEIFYKWLVVGKTLPLLNLWHNGVSLLQPNIVISNFNNDIKLID
jgi:hypothetical protein